MYNEMSFLFNLTDANITNTDNTTSIFKTPNGVAYTVRYKSKDKFSNSQNIKDDLRSNVYGYKTGSINSKNPYSRLVEDMNGPMDITYADLSYLKDLGRYPLNRLIILRRYPEGVIVPNNLNEFDLNDGPRPIATVIGWIDESEDSMFNVSFSEKWERQTIGMHELLGQIVKSEFGTDLSKIIPSYSWSQGLLFGFMNKIGLTSDFDFDHIPQGDPNVLQEGATRSGGGLDNKFTLESDIKVKFRTSYTQRLVGNIDPGSAYLDIINNLTRFGTSNVNFIYSPSSRAMQDLIRLSKSNDFDVWGGLILDYTKAASTIIKKNINTILDSKKEIIKSSKEKENSDTSFKETAIKAKGALLKKANEAVKIFKKFLSAGIASTIGKYKWNMVGAIAAGTGINSTPWHMTIGNPYSPMLSIGNIVAENVEVSFNNELSYNDISNEMDVNIDLKFGRNLGGQEIRKMFNNSYTREYLPKDIGQKTNKQ